MNRHLREKKVLLNGRTEESQVLFENVPAYIAVLDPNYRIVKANRYFKDTFGDQVGQFCYHAYKGLPEKCRECPAEHTFRQGTLQVTEETGRSRDGREVCYLVYSAPIHDRRGRVRYALEMSIDLTQRKNLEKALQANQAFLTNLIENSSCGIIALDSQGRVMVFNRSAEHIFGYKGSEVTGSKEIDRFFPKKISQRILSFLEGKAGKEALPSSPQETWLRSKDGARIPVRFSAVGLFQQRSTLGAVGFFEDLRPFKSLEREKLQAEKLAAVGQTVAGFAHGIKNIVTGLESGIYVAQSALRKKDDPLFQKGWGMVEKNIEKISGLVKGLLSYSKARVPELQWVNTNDLAQEVCSFFQEKARQGGIQIILDPDPHISLAYLDPKGIDACLMNLLSNAIDACLLDKGKSHHQVTVRTRRNADQSISLEVEDDGIGMTEEVKNKLFASFFSSKGTSGTGLGLFVTQKIVHELGGFISVETKPQKGSLFCITLPQEDLLPLLEKEEIS